jgi:hypothetical protein
MSGMPLRSVAETLPPLKGGNVPQDLNSLWGDFDPRKEPLEVEITTETGERRQITVGI